MRRWRSEYTEKIGGKVDMNCFGRTEFLVGTWR